MGQEIMDKKKTGLVFKTESVRHLCHLDVILCLVIRRDACARQPCIISKTNHFSSLSAQFDALIVFPLFPRAQPYSD